MVNEIYKSREWKLLHPYIRADLLPVAENVKKGTQIEIRGLQKKYEQSRLLDKWLEKSDLAHRKHKFTHYACRDESLLDKLWEEKIGIDDFLGYPKCCIENHREHGKKFIQYLNDEIELSEVPLPQGVLIGREMIKAIEKGEFNPVLNYSLHMPCSIYCMDSIEFGERIKNCLEENDFEVAEYIRQFNEGSWLSFGKEWNEEIWYKFAKERKKEYCG